MKNSTTNTWPKDGIVQLGSTVAEGIPITASVNEHRFIRDPQFDMHYALELGIVLSGRMSRYYKDHETSLARGDVWLNGIWEPHGYQVAEKPCRVVVMTVLPQVLAGLQVPEVPGFNWLAPFTSPPDKRPMPTAEAAGELVRIAEAIAARACGDTPEHKLRRRVYLMEILLELCTGWEAPPSTSTEARNPYEQLTPAMELVIGSQRMITVEEAAGVCGLSRNVFSRKFQQLMGVSFPNFCLRHRLSGAATQLLGSDDSVQDIALDWDFADISHLHHRFVKHYGATPRHYRSR